jgi:DNA polymerase kappa
LTTKMNDDNSNNKGDASSFSHLFVFSGANKAGMDKVDKELQAQVIYEMSKKSEFFNHALKQDIKTKEKIDKMKILMSKITAMEKIKLQNDASRKLIEIEECRNLNRICAVFDMDMFFAAVAIRDRPHLKDLPVAVGGMGMISTTNYVARKYGVRAAMPGFIGKKLCPELVFVPIEFDKYSESSSIVKNILLQYDSQLHSMSLDEFYVDLTSYCEVNFTKWKNNNNDKLEESYKQYANHQLNSRFDRHIFDLHCMASDVVSSIRHDVFIQTKGLTCSAGIATNFQLAKIAADVNKPNGQYQIQPSKIHIFNFLDTLPCRKICGIGKITEKMLLELNIVTMKDLRDNMYVILHIFTPSLAQFLIRSSIGVSEDEINNNSSSMKTSNTDNQSKKRHTHSSACSSSIMNYVTKITRESDKAELGDSDGDNSNNDTESIVDGNNNNVKNVLNEENSMNNKTVSNTTVNNNCNNSNSNSNSNPDCNTNNKAKNNNSSNNDDDGYVDNVNIINRKSMSGERTFRNCNSLNELIGKLYDICKRLDAQLKEENLLCNIIYVKLKSANFDVVSHQHTITGYKYGNKSNEIKQYIQDFDVIFKIASNLLSYLVNNNRNSGCYYRLLGVKLSRFQYANSNSVPKEHSDNVTIITDLHQCNAGGSGGGNHSITKYLNNKSKNDVKSGNIPSETLIADVPASTRNISFGTGNTDVLLHSHSHMSECGDSSGYISEYSEYTDISNDCYEKDPSLFPENDNSSCIAEDGMAFDEENVDDSSRDCYWGQSVTTTNRFSIEGKLSPTCKYEDRSSATNSLLVRDYPLLAATTDDVSDERECNNVATSVNSFTCPICSVFICGDLHSFNDHIDNCLTYSYIKETSDVISNTSAEGYNSKLPIASIKSKKSIENTKNKRKANETSYKNSSSKSSSSCSNLQSQSRIDRFCIGK